MSKASFRERLAQRALLSCSLAMGLVLGSGTAFAYWTLTAPTITDIPQLNAGTFDMTVGPTGTEGLTTWCNGSLCDAATSGNYVWTAASIGNMYPGESFAFQLTIRNSSNGNAAMTVTANTFSVDTGSFGSYLTVTPYAFGSQASNNNGALGGRSGGCSPTNPLSIPVSATLSGPGATTTLCVLVTLDANTPQSLQSTTATAPFSLNLSAQQAPTS